MVVGGFSAFPLVPHTLVIAPAKKPFHIEVDDRTAAKTLNVVEAQWDPRFSERIQRFVARGCRPDGHADLRVSRRNASRTVCANRDLTQPDYSCCG
jgi:hypothetical protein